MTEDRQAVIDCLRAALAAEVEAAGKGGALREAVRQLDRPRVEVTPAGASPHDSRFSLDAGIDGLLTLLAAQAAKAKGKRARPEVLQRMVEDRGIAFRILASIGHLVHYGSGPVSGRLKSLFDQLVEVLRRQSRPGPSGALPGDVVVLVEAIPERHVKAGTLMSIRFVGDDGTLDIGHETIGDDYIMYTVPFSSVRRLDPPDSGEQKG